MTMPLAGVPVNVRVVMQVGCMTMEVCVLVGCEVLIYAKAVARRHRRVSSALGIQYASTCSIMYLQ
jgi:hypothetical protein